MMKILPIGQLSAALLIAVSMSGCLDENRPAASKREVGPTGHIQLALSASGASGSVYRLRDAVFNIYGLNTGTTVSVSSEDDPSSERIDVSLTPDTYAVYLADGYRLERVSEGNSDTEVDGGAANDGGMPGGGNSLSRRRR